MTARERPASSRRPLLRSLALTAQTVREHVTDDPVLLALQVSRRLPPAAVGGAAGILTRNRLVAQGGEAAVEAFRDRIKPLTMAALLITVVLLFGFQGEKILANPLVIVLIAVPLLIQSYGIFAIAYGAARALRVPFDIAAPCAMIGTSNFFELAVAVAISLFGLKSGDAVVEVAAPIEPTGVTSAAVPVSQHCSKPSISAGSIWRSFTVTPRSFSIWITVWRVMPLRKRSARGVWTSPSRTKKMLAPVASAT